jgi:hypothetical protein
MMSLKHYAQRILTLLLTVGIMVPTTIWATDLSAPVIRLSMAVSPPKPGKPLRISASVSDNQALSRVLLRYRKAGSNDAFASIPMQKAAESSLYSAAIPAGQLSEPGVEYFVEAVDTTENISQEPFPSHPRIVTIQGTGSNAVAGTRKINWLWVAAGVVAAGALAASSGGGGDASSDPGDTGATLTITAPTP